MGDAVRRGHPNSDTEKIKTSAKISRSIFSRRLQIVKKDRTAPGRQRSVFRSDDTCIEDGAGSTNGGPRFDPEVQANLEAFTSIGLVENDFVLDICKMDHVTPDYILGQKRRLEAERRYSGGLLLTVIRSNDYLPEKYKPARELGSLGA